ncbi:hypothetical protein FHR99_000972 [Litorivivens lipolytica]|uniref:Uncharacterized protein n=1 Tax=Litorivivens lipolytica TaxID=1524264 RepID=A0A7W4W3G1_9GAMM|nr:hypothetical protein [Litorivivens lipolytica]
MSVRGATHVHLTIPAEVLERLIASGLLCAADVCCDSLRDKAQLTEICKRCCMSGTASDKCGADYNISSLRPSSTSRI